MGKEVIKQVLGVLRAGFSLGVELHRRKRQRLVTDSFVGSVVGVDEELFPSIGALAVLERVAVVLRGDHASFGELVDGGLVVPSVSEFELVGLEAGGHAHQEVAHADAKDGHRVFLGGLDVDEFLEVVSSQLDGARVL